MNNELEQIRKKGVKAPLDAMFWHLPGGTESSTEASV